MAQTPTILIVEDSRFFASMIRRRIQDELGFEVEWRATYAEAVETIDCCKEQFLVALLDVTLPDAPNGEIVDYSLKAGIPSIIFTGGFDGKMRNQFLSWNIVDYILKDSNTSVDTLLEAVSRVHKNRSIKTLVVDDSKAMRDAVARLLGVQLYQVLTATNGEEALGVLGDNPDIRLIVTDYDMPRMDGFEFIRKVREDHGKNELAIIGMSASGDPLLSAKLIKSGANDFVPKPFQVEEFHCRVSHAIEMLENIALIKDLSYKDPLTRLYNRRYFFENAPGFIQETTRAGQTYCVAMLDIDHFKNVNDTHGHDGGDAVLKSVSSLVATCFADQAIVCRFGGEEFCVLAAHEHRDEIVNVFEGLRTAIGATSVAVGQESVSVTISTGVCCDPGDLETMLKLADSRLYIAKETGRNKVVAATPQASVREGR